MKNRVPEATVSIRFCVSYSMYFISDKKKKNCRAVTYKKWSILMAKYTQKKNLLYCNNKHMNGKQKDLLSF